MPNVKTWDEVEEKLKLYPDGDFTDFIISGHGSYGGAASTAGGLTPKNLPLSTAKLIKQKLQPTGRVIVLSCSACDPTNAINFYLWNARVGVPAIGNMKGVGGGNVGDGNWIIVDTIK